MHLPRNRGRKEERLADTLVELNAGAQRRWGHSFIRHPSDANAFFRDLEGVEKRQFSQFELFSLVIIRKGLIR